MSDEGTVSIPSVCNCCRSSNVIFTTNDKVYGKKVGKWPYCYRCTDCGAMVGVHEGTNKALGKLANSKTRRLRKQVHEVFDKLWQKGYLTRKDAYNKLALHLDIHPNNCHISWLTDSQLVSASTWSEHYLANNPPILRRQAKKNAKHFDREHRDAKQRNRRKSDRKSRFSRGR